MDMHAETEELLETMFSVGSVTTLYKERSDQIAAMENIRGLSLAVVKLTTVHVTKLPLQHKTCKLGMICSAKGVLTEDLCIVQKEEFSITCYMYDTHT
jgi:hypothetical protein